MSIMRTRRELLLDGLRAASALGVAGLIGQDAILAAAQAAPGGARGRRRGPRGFRIGACDWTLGKGGNPEALELAQKLGLDGLQVDASVNNRNALKAEVQKVYQEKMQATGMRISTLALGVYNSKPYVSDPEAQQLLSDTIDACAPLRARGILLAFFGKGDLRTDPKNVETLIAKLKEIAPKAEQARVRLLVESMLPAETLMKIVDGVGSTAVGVYYDVGNTKQAGYDIVKEIKMLGKHISEFHAKDHNTLYGKEGGEVDFPSVRKAMDEIGYRGWIHIEGTKFPLGLEESVRADAEYLRTVFPRRV